MLPKPKIISSNESEQCKLHVKQILISQNKALSEIIAFNNKKINELQQILNNLSSVQDEHASRKNSNENSIYNLNTQEL